MVNTGQSTGRDNADGDDKQSVVMLPDKVNPDI